ncbi:MAG: exosortase [Acidobacteriales bacterium]|nr:exosortase [Terriglobales bacterium]
MNTVAMNGERPQENAGAWIRRTYAWIILLALIGLLYGKTLAALAGVWWSNDDYSHGLLVPFVLGYLVYQKWGYVKSLPIQQSVWGLVVIIVSQVVHVVGFLGAEFFLQRVSFVVMIAGLVLYLWGWRHLWEAGFALLLLLLAVPLPALVFNAVALPLQFIASAWAEQFLHMTNVPVFREGNILALASINLTVAEACSGIRSLMSLITLGVMVGYFLPFRWWLRSFFILSTVPIAIIANSLRVGGTGYLAHHYGEAVARGFFHSFSGWLVFVFALVVLLAEATILLKLRWGRVEEK